jgi:phosphate transport system substrate-binding protein
MQNKAGEFVRPGTKSALAALATVTMPENLRAWAPDPDGKECYPIATFTWILARKQYPSAAVAKNIKDLFTYALTEGQRDCASLGYVPLPENVRQAALAGLEKIGPAQ